VYSLVYNAVYLIQTMFTALLHERDHKSFLFRSPEAGNCITSAYDPTRVIKMVVDTDSDLTTLITRVEGNFAPYLSLTEVVKILDDSGEILYTVRSDRFPKLR